VTLYLADTSIWACANTRSRPDITEKLAERLERAEICTCVPVVLETMHRAKSGEEYSHLFEALFEPLSWLPLTSDCARRALDVQRELAPKSHGNHRRPATDFLIAATAEAATDEVVLWFFDRDLSVISRHTGQPHEAEGSIGPGR
jgi:predicted nucleic acid-binding protein